MWGLILLFLAFIVVFTLTMYWVVRWSARFVEQQITERLMAIEQIVNDEQVPQAWLAPYRQRAHKLMDAGAAPDQVRALSGVARKRCVANIRELIRFVEARSLSDSEATKQFMLRSLREQAARWEDEATWHELVDLTAAIAEEESGD